jgi:hypothetical protein
MLLIEKEPRAKEPKGGGTGGTKSARKRSA